MKYVIEQIVTKEALTTCPKEYFEHKILDELGDRIARSGDVKLAWMEDPTLGRHAYKLCAGIDIEDSKIKTPSLKDSLAKLESVKDTIQPYASFDDIPLYTLDNISTLANNITAVQSLDALQTNNSVFINSYDVAATTISAPALERLKDLEKFLHILAKRQVQPDSVTKKEQHFISQILTTAIEEVKKEWD